MLKSIILATTSTAWLLSLSLVATAGNQINAHNSKNRIDLINRESNSSRTGAISAQDLKGINKAIVDRYKKINDGPKYPSTEGPVFFYEVKAMKISSFERSDTSGSATIDAVENQRAYTYTASKRDRGIAAKKYAYTFTPIPSEKLRFIVNNRSIKLMKENGKWRALD
jgi:hypothetical protein